MKASIITVLLLAGAGVVLSAEDSLRSALLTLPPQYLAGIPLDQRQTLVKAIARSVDQMDETASWVHWFSDGHLVDGTCMFWMKELPREGKAPLILVHMAKPFADGRKPGKDQTFVFEPSEGKWTDVTAEVIPVTVDLTWHFRSRKQDTVIEVAEWKEIE
ncbi:MAG: hypothetical protein EOP85_14810, partial [Verrucomicrobiaceae bacterium]